MSILAAGVCEKDTPPEKSTHWNSSFQNTKSGAGEQFLLLDCRARACAKGLFFFHTHRYHSCAGVTIISTTYIFRKSQSILFFHLHGLHFIWNMWLLFYVSSDILKFRLLKWLSDHPMKALPCRPAAEGPGLRSPPPHLSARGARPVAYPRSAVSPRNLNWGNFKSRVSNPRAIAYFHSDMPFESSNLPGGQKQ